jgi:hypothetical protein
VTEKWLNVILDLHGVLCVSEDLLYDVKTKTIIKRDERQPKCQDFTIGFRRVTLRPFWKEFLIGLSTVATVSIWSSLEWSYSQKIVDCLFSKLEKPSLVFGEEQCNVLKFETMNGELLNYRVRGTQNDFLYKPLDKLYEFENSIFTEANTIIIDHDPLKHSFNSPDNVVLLDRWSYEGHKASDSLLIVNLLPWIQRLHSFKPAELGDFRKDNIFGNLHLREVDSSMYCELENALEVSNRLLAKFQRNSLDYQEHFRRVQHEKWKNRRKAHHKSELTFVRSTPRKEEGIP